MADDSTLETVSNPEKYPILPDSGTAVAPTVNPGKSKARITLSSLPEEIQQRILDMMMGELQAPSTSVSETNNLLRKWNSVMRHPRSRYLADLSLVCERWRRLVQGRIYRHSKRN